MQNLLYTHFWRNAEIETKNKILNNDIFTFLYKTIEDYFKPRFELVRTELDFNAAQHT